MPDVKRLVVALKKPKQQLKASHSRSVTPLPVTASLPLPRRISSAPDIYPASDFAPPATVLFLAIKADLESQ